MLLNVDLTQNYSVYPGVCCSICLLSDVKILFRFPPKEALLSIPITSLLNNQIRQKSIPQFWNLHYPKILLLIKFHFIYLSDSAKASYFILRSFHLIVNAQECLPSSLPTSSSSSELSLFRLTKLLTYLPPNISGHCYFSNIVKWFLTAAQGFCQCLL